jgi:hypothetical protein
MHYKQRKATSIQIKKKKTNENLFLVMWKLNCINYNSNRACGIVFIIFSPFFFLQLAPLDLGLLGDNIDTIKKNTESLIDASKEVGLEINVQPCFSRTAPRSESGKCKTCPS